MTSSCLSPAASLPPTLTSRYSHFTTTTAKSQPGGQAQCSPGPPLLPWAPPPCSLCLDSPHPERSVPDGRAGGTLWSFCCRNPRIPSNLRSPTASSAANPRRTWAVAVSEGNPPSAQLLRLLSCNDLHHTLVASPQLSGRPRKASPEIWPGNPSPQISLPPHLLQVLLSRQLPSHCYHFQPRQHLPTPRLHSQAFSKLPDASLLLLKRKAQGRRHCGHTPVPPGLATLTAHQTHSDQPPKD